MLNELRVTNKYHGRWPNRRYVNIMRGSPLGNPFPVHELNPREDAIWQYKQWLIKQLEEGNPSVVAELDRIAAMVMDNTDEPVCLECCCHPKACHGDVIIKVILEVLEQAA
ncbi:DUF4326 domain-containing protein [Paraburkholderia sp. SIMBA_049]